MKSNGKAADSFALALADSAPWQQTVSAGRRQLSAAAADES
jgi:hypothetical protein